MINIMRKISSIFIIILTFLQAQNLDQYSQAIEQGQLSTVREDIKQLKDEYPDNPEVLFLSAVVETDAEKALDIYKNIINQYPESQTAKKAKVEIIKYHYTNGLYHKTVEEAKKFITENPNSELSEELVPLLFSSLKAIKRTDLIEFYKKEFSKNYPELRPYLKDSDQLSLYTIKEKPYTLDTERKATTKYAVQIGVFSNLENARSLLNKLKEKGYNAYIKEKSSNQRFQAVKIGPFTSRAKANQIGRELERKFNLNYIIVRP